MDTSNLFRVDGMVAVVTGGGTGIGLFIARALAGAGAKKVYILGRRQQVLDEAAAEHPGCLVPVVCDVTSKESLQSAVDLVSKDEGYINLLVANSAQFGPVKRLDYDKPIPELRKDLFDEFAMEDFTNTLNVNVTGAYFTMLAFLELLDAGNKKALQGGFGAPLENDSNVVSIQSQVIFTGSIGAYSRHKLSGLPYTASKAAITHLAKHASTNLVKHEIRVNVLAPGLFPTVLASHVTGNRDPGKEDYDDPLFIPARRFGGFEEMGGSVLYLASRAGSYCNGFVLVNDGGKLAFSFSEY